MRNIMLYILYQTLESLNQEGLNEYDIKCSKEIKISSKIVVDNLIGKAPLVD